MNRSEVIDLCIRYSILVCVGVLNLLMGNKGVLYRIFTPLTVLPTFQILNVLYGAALLPNNVIFFKGYFAYIIPACVAGAAYFFLLILNMSTPMRLHKRLASLLFLWASFLALNIIRITIFGMLVFRGYKYFDIAHISTWYFGSTILIVLIWFVNIKLFRITNIPAYSDLKSLMADIRLR